jgi:peptidyl-tRNA hydrolase, PTH1 family
VPRWLVVGLGNPGRGYEGTYHNAGREVVLRLASKRGVVFREKDDARVSEIDEGWLMLPETYMNLSGEAAAPFAQKKGIEPKHVVAVVDDLHIPAGTIRVRAGGSAAGHNGLRSLEAALGTEEYPRLRIGIGPDPGGAFRTRYVLARPRPEVLGDYIRGQETALVALETILARGVEDAMRIFNAG